MQRQADPDLPPEELLYRSAEPGHLTTAGVSPAAVEMPRCSFNRAKHSNPEDVLTASRPLHTAIVFITCAGLPKDPVPRDDGIAAYVFFGTDDPHPQEDPGNAAHCEVRIRRTDMAFTKNHRPPKDVTMKARESLARKLRPLVPRPQSENADPSSKLSR